MKTKDKRHSLLESRLDAMWIFLINPSAFQGFIALLCFLTLFTILACYATFMHSTIQFRTARCFVSKTKTIQKW